MNGVPQGIYILVYPMLGLLQDLIYLNSVVQHHEHVNNNNKVYLKTGRTTCP